MGIQNIILSDEFFGLGVYFANKPQTRGKGAWIEFLGISRVLAHKRPDPKVANGENATDQKDKQQNNGDLAHDLRLADFFVKIHVHGSIVSCEQVTLANYMKGSTSVNEW